MSPQADFIVSNGTGAAVRSDLNVQFAAIVSNNSGATEPATMYAYQWWADTTTGLLKLRNSANSAWVTIRQLDGEFSTVPVENGTAAAPSIFFKDSGTDTGLFSPGADQVAISTGGTSRLAVSTTAVSSTLAVDVPLGAVGTPSITFTGDLNTGIWSPTADTIAFSEGGAEAMRIDSSSRLLIGASSVVLDSSHAKVQVASSGGGALVLADDSTTVAADDDIGLIRFYSYAGSVYEECARIFAEADLTQGSGDKPTRLVFSTTADGASSPTERLRITSTGQVRLAGAGITFNGDTAAANELDDYEEGTFTPTLAYQTPGTSSITQSNNGQYTKVGNLVYIQLTVALSAFTKGTASGELRITGLPFATKTGLSETALSMTFYSAPLPTLAGQFPIAQAAASGGTFITLFVASHNSISFDNFTNPDGDAQYKISGSYLV